MDSLNEMNQLFETLIPSSGGLPPLRASESLASPGQNQKPACEQPQQNLSVSAVGILDPDTFKPKKKTSTPHKPAVETSSFMRNWIKSSSQQNATAISPTPTHTEARATSTSVQTSVPPASGDPNTVASVAALKHHSATKHQLEESPAEAFKSVRKKRTTKHNPPVAAVASIVQSIPKPVSAAVPSLSIHKQTGGATALPTPNPFESSDSEQEALQQNAARQKVITTMRNTAEGKKLAQIFGSKPKPADGEKTSKPGMSNFFSPNLPPWEPPVIKLQFEDPLLLNPTYTEEESVVGTLGAGSTGPSSMTVVNNSCLQINTTYLQRYLRTQGASELLENTTPAAQNETPTGPLAGLEHVREAIQPKKHVSLAFDELTDQTGPMKTDGVSVIEPETIEADTDQMDGADPQNPKSKSSLRRDTIQLDPDRARTSKKILLGQTEVLFPYEPYKEQMQYMEHLVGCLDSANNGLFESPTGTGKTLSLLVGSLGWLKKQIDEGKNTQAKIFYASRTHSQLKQLVDELKSTAYIPNISVMGSRDQLCINKELSESEGGERNARCFRLINGEYCQYYRNITTHRSKYLHAYGDKLLDIEEMHFVGKSNAFCPFYFSRSLIKNAHIVFLPYSYLTFTEFRVLLREYINNSVIIIDEAHNISQSAEDGASVKITSKDTQMILKDIDAITKAIRITIASTATNANLGGKARKPKEGEEVEEDEPMTPAKLLEEEMIVKAIRFLESVVKKAEGLKAPIDRFRTIINTKFTEEKSQGGTLEAWEIFKMFHDAVTGGTLDKCFKEAPQDWRREMVRNINDIFDVLDHVTQNKKLNFLNTNNLMKWSLTLVRVIELYWNFRRYEKLDNCWKKQMISHYTIVLEDKTKTDGKPNVMMILKCLTPSLAFRDIQEEHPRSIVFTSGTLSPMELYSTEFEIPFEHTFRCGHVINPDRQLFAAVVKHVEPHIKVNFSFDHRHDPAMKKALGRRLVELSQVTPKGMLLFFTSYAMMDNYYEFWKTENIIAELEQRKVVCKEPSQAHLIQAEFMRFSAGINQKAGAVFFAVCGGKLSEGIDFTDEMARTVVLMGVPYPNTQDVHVKSKKLYLDRFKQQEDSFEILTKTGIVRKNRMSGHDWYNYQAIRLVNQAIGRVIRHKYDFGAVLMLDARFGVRQNLEEMSKWVSNQIQKVEQFTTILNSRTPDAKQLTDDDIAEMGPLPSLLEEFFDSAESYTRSAMKSLGTGGKRKKEERIEFLIKRRDQIMKVGVILAEKFAVKAKLDHAKKAKLKKLKQEMAGKNTATSINAGDTSSDDSESEAVANPWTGEINGINIDAVDEVDCESASEIDISDHKFPVKTKSSMQSKKPQKPKSKPKPKPKQVQTSDTLGKRVIVEDIDMPIKKKPAQILPPKKVGLPSAAQVVSLDDEPRNRGVMRLTKPTKSKQPSKTSVTIDIL